MNRPAGFMDKAFRDLLRIPHSPTTQRELWLLSCADAIEEQGCTCRLTTDDEFRRVWRGEQVDATLPCAYCKLGFGE